MNQEQKKKFGRARRPAAAALLLALAALCELLFVQMINRPVDASLPAGGEAAARRDYAGDAFTGWEFEQTCAQEYYALAYNSYFSLDGLDGVWAQTLSVRLLRDPADDTETVVYYDAAVNGVRGEYMAALVRTGEGLYTARLDADALYGLRIYPTERVRSTVGFGGATLNPFIVRERFSPARLLLWLFCLLSLWVLARWIWARRTKRAPAPGGWGRWYILLQTAALLAAFQAPRLFSAAAGRETLLLLAALGGFSGLYAAVWLVVRRLKTPHAKLAACVLACGAVFCVATAPMQAPDEAAHYLRTYSIACGDFTFDGAAAYPDDVRRLVELFPGWFYKEVQQKGQATVLDRLAVCAAEEGEPFAGQTDASQIQLIFPYLVPAVGVLTGRLLGSALAGFYLGRFANVCLLALCAYFGLKWAERYRGAVICTALFPLTLFMGASYSYDACLLALLLLYLGLVFGARLTGRGFAGLALCFGGIAAIKPLYLPLALLLFTIPAARAGGKKRRLRAPRLCAFALLLAAGAAAYALALGYAALFMRGIRPSVLPAGVDVAAQIRYILSNPVRYALTAAVDGYLNCFYLDELGLFGWLDVPAVLTGLLAPVVVALTAAFYADEAPARPKSDRWVFAGTAVLIYGIVVTGFYCTWSTLGSTSILGVQARYLIPALPALSALLSALLGGRLRFARAQGGERDALAVYLCAGLGLLAALETALLYFFT